MLVNGARARLVDMVNGSCGDGGMNTAAAIHNDVLSEGGRLRVFLPPRTVGLDGWTIGGLEGARQACTHTTRRNTSSSALLTIKRGAWQSGS
jgi:hypothetical protein